MTGGQGPLSHAHTGRAQPLAKQTVASRLRKALQAVRAPCAEQYAAPRLRRGGATTRPWRGWNCNSSS